MALSKRLRFEILRRDNHTCRYCGAKAPDVKILVDHVLPEALGGRTEAGNLVASCEPCNTGKSSVAPDSALVADVDRDQIRWARAMERARAIRAQHVEEREAYAGYFEALWAEWRTGGSIKQAKPIPLDDGWRSTVDRFFEYQVEPDDIKYAVTAAMTAAGVYPENTFRYFCGVVWNIIRELQTMATDLVVAEVEDEFYRADSED